MPELEMCPHLEFLSRPQPIPGTKREVRFIDSGHIVNMVTGQWSWQPILRGIKETPAGRLVLTSDWHPIKFCPVCGVEVAEKEVAEKEDSAEVGESE